MPEHLTGRPIPYGSCDFIYHSLCDYEDQCTNVITFGGMFFVFSIQKQNSFRMVPDVEDETGSGGCCVVCCSGGFLLMCENPENEICMLFCHLPRY